MKKSPLLYRLWDLEKFRDLPFFIGFGTWRNSEPSLPISALGLRNIPTSPPIQALARDIASGTSKNRVSIQARGSGRAKHRAKRDVSRRIQLSPCIKALGLGKIPSFPPLYRLLGEIPSPPRPAKRGPNRQNMEHDVHLLAWPINTFPLL